MKEVLLSNKKHFAGFGFAALLALASWIIAIYFWDKLPGQIPTHFGFAGQPDQWAAKSIWSVFFIPFLQTVMLGSFIFLYWKPQYSDMPTTLWLMTMDAKVRDHAFSLIRIMLVVISVWIGTLFTYLTYGIVASAQMKSLGLSPWIMVGVMGGMIAWLIYWTVKVYRVTREAIKKKK